MKLHRLELEGFGPFAARQTVDFDVFDDDGIFLISGRTGAGKSSVLDGVSFALFGSVPRYESGEKRLRSDYCAPDAATEVSLEFSVDGTRWRVARSPEYSRPKARGIGMTKVAPAALLEESVAGEWIGRAARSREVAHVLEEILGLNQQQFLQVILLAQNRFADFLLAGNDDRQALLRTLFGSRTYVDYRTAMQERRKQSEQVLIRSGDGVVLLLDEADGVIEDAGLHGRNADESSPEAPALREAGIDERLAQIDRAVDRGRYRAEIRGQERDRLEAEHARATEAHSLLTALHSRQEDRDRTRAALARLEEESPRVADEREMSEAARRAEALRDPIEAAEKTAASAAIAADSQLAAVHAWSQIDETLEDVFADADGVVPEHALEALRIRVDELTGDLAQADAAARQEIALVALEGAEATDAAAVVESAERLADVDARRSQIPAALAETVRALAPLDGAAVALESARTQLISSRGIQEAADETARLSVRLHDAEVAYAERIAESERARQHVTTLLRRRLDGFAGELAQTLVDGTPCAVCGSIEHPHPAAPDADAVTDEVFTRAEHSRDAAAASERAAATRALKAREEHAAAAARAGGTSLDQAAERLAAALHAETQAVQASAERARLEAERERLEQSAIALNSEHDTVRADHADLARAAAVSAERADAARTIVDAARGGFATVRARVEDLRRRRDLGRALVHAAQERRACDTSLRAAKAERDARVAASDFPDAATATAALLDERVRAAIDERVRAHEVTLATEKAKLRELEIDLAGVPDEALDLEASQARVAVAREHWNDAVIEAQSCLQSVETVSALVARARTTHAATAVLTAEHAAIAALADAVSGRNASRMDLETYVLAAELEEIVDAANLRLDDMSAGRYRLAHTDARAARNAASGLGLEVVDAYTGRSRPAQSLSGGETFLASLALALGLAEVVTARTGGVRLDTLFVDEGFGSLDSDTLELAMRTLDELRQGGRTVGVISHVEAMKEQIPAQLMITATPRGPSVISQAGALAAS